MKKIKAWAVLDKRKALFIVGDCDSYLICPTQRRAIYNSMPDETVVPCTITLDTKKARKK